MQFTVVINMRNPNALIAMAFVSQNSNNPYSVFCEYIKYCIFSDTADTMSISDIRTSVSKEFGLYIPYNIAVKCLRFLYKGIIIKHNKTEPTYTKTSLFLCEKRRFLWPGLRKEGNLFKLAGPGGLAFFHLTKKEVSKWPMKK